VPVANAMTLYAALILGVGAMLFISMAFKPKRSKPLPPVKASHLQHWGGHFKVPIRMNFKGR
jgi:hypothetical protein